MDIQPYTSYDELEAHISSKNYASDALCFVLAWHTYNNDVDNPNFKLLIKTDFT